MDFARRKAPCPRACVTPEPVGCYGECPRRSLVKSFHAHEKEFWRSQQLQQLEMLDGMFQQYKQNSRRGNKGERDVTATWTPRPYLCYSPARYDPEYPGQSLLPGQLARAGSQTPNQSLNMLYRSNLSPCGTLSPRPTSPLEDEDVLKEALVAARNVMEDPKPIHPMMSVSGSSVRSGSDCRSASPNLEESINEIGVASGLQWEEDSFYGLDSPRSNHSSHQTKSPTKRDYAEDLRRRHAQLQDKYDSYHAQLYKGSEAKRHVGGPLNNHVTSETSLRKTYKDKNSVLDCLQAVTPTARLLQEPCYRSVNGVIERTSSQGRANRSPPKAKMPSRCASARVSMQAKAPVHQVKIYAQSVKPEATGKPTTTYGPPKRLTPTKSKRYEAGLGHLSFNKGGSTPFGSAQRLPDSKSGSGGSMRTPREDGASSKPRTPLSQNRVDMKGVGSKTMRASSYSNMRR